MYPGDYLYETQVGTYSGYLRINSAFVIYFYSTNSGKAARGEPVR